MNDHSFNPFIAKKYGTSEAIFIKTMILWTSTNAAKQSKNQDGSLKHYHEGRWWAFGTPVFFANYLIYFTPKQIRTIIEKCINKGLIVKSNFNQFGYDKTSWYALTDLALFELNLDVTCLKPRDNHICPNGHMDVPKLSDGCAQTDEPIPNTKPSTKPKTTTTCSSDSFLNYKPQDDTRTDEEFLNQCEYHVNNRDKTKYTEAQARVGLINLLKKGRFDKPIGYKSKNIKANRPTQADFQNYAYYLNHPTSQMPDELKWVAAFIKQ